MKVIILKFQRERGQTCSVFSCRPDSWVINLERLQESLWNLNNSIKRKLLFNLHHSPQNLYIFYWLIKSSTHLEPLSTLFLVFFICLSSNVLMIQKLKLPWAPSLHRECPSQSGDSWPPWAACNVSRRLCRFCKCSTI